MNHGRDHGTSECGTGSCFEKVASICVGDCHGFSRGETWGEVMRAGSHYNKNRGRCVDGADHTRHTSRQRERAPRSKRAIFSPPRRSTFVLSTVNGIDVKGVARTPRRAKAEKVSGNSFIFETPNTVPDTFFATLLLLFRRVTRHAVEGQDRLNVRIPTTQAWMFQRHPAGIYAFGGLLRLLIS
jgi:hypothetical protein